MKRQLYGLISLILFLVMVSAPIAIELMINSVLVAREFDIYGEYRWISPAIWMSLYIVTFVLLIKPIEKAIFLAT